MKTTVQLFDYQREYFSQNCARMMHIGKEIHRIVKEKGVKVNWLAEQVDVSRSNMQKVFNRADIGAIMLAKISKALNHNFLYQVETEASLTTMHEPEASYQNKETELLKEQLELTKRLMENKDKLLNEYKQRANER